MIDDAADMMLACGVRLSETREGAAVLEMARAYAELQESRLTAARMPANKFVVRKEDMSQNGRLRLLKENDGDICVAIIDAKGNMADIQFCTPGIGGGKSVRTLAALNELALAMIEDNKTSPEQAVDR